MNDVQDLIAGVRRFRADQGISPAAGPRPEGDAPRWSLGGGGRSRTLAVASTVTDVELAPETVTPRVVTRVAGLHRPGGRDRSRRRTARLDKAIAGRRNPTWPRSRQSSATPAFVDKAPEEVVAKERAKQAEFEGLLEKLRTQRDAL
jgi:valyl-tRNA synthetase